VPTLVGKYEGIRPIGKHRLREKDNITTDSGKNESPTSFYTTWRA
jgi:hypothetical protein